MTKEIYQGSDLNEGLIGKTVTLFLENSKFNEKRQENIFHSIEFTGKLIGFSITKSFPEGYENDPSLFYTVILEGFDKINTSGKNNSVVYWFKNEAEHTALLK